MTATAKQIRQMLLAAGIRPRKSLGQHFLIDTNLMNCLIQAARIDPKIVILEVGCGVGNLTELLLERAAAVLAVEIDRNIAHIAKANLSKYNNLHLLVGDIIIKGAINNKVLELIEPLTGQGERAWAMVANLPYNIASPLIINLAYLTRNRPAYLCFTVQKEVADRLAADPPGKVYGPLSVLIQAMGQVDVLRRLGPAVFYPRPKVSSAMVRVDLVSDEKSRVYNPRQFRRIVSAVFMHRRKTIQSGWIKPLAAERGAAALAACKLAEIDVSHRPGQIAVRQYIGLANALAQDARWTQQER